jgi:NAD(P)-dependent dehydrogenase (short-subunit alcohol dehydrogenase family)
MWQLETMKLQDKVALITGAGSGLGRASAILFASEGASIGVADIDLESAEETANEISRAGGRALALQVDVSNGVSVESMVQQTVERFGILDVLYNNAGTAGKVDFLASMPEDVFDRVLAVNLRGVYLGMKYALPYMAKIGGASVINQSSAAGLVGIRGSAAYCASKAGVIALTKVAALEYARYKIRVNCICPGLINTPMSQELLGGELDPNDPDAIRRVSVMGRIGRPEEIAKMALFLASEDSSYATGACFVVDGGWTAS